MSQLDRIEKLLEILSERLDKSIKMLNEAVEAAIVQDKLIDNVNANLDRILARLEHSATKEEIAALARIQGRQQLELEIMRRQ